MLVVDDAQWLDEASAVVLHQLVAQGDVTLLATMRSGAPRPDPITALWKDGLVERIDVVPLDEHSVRDIVEAALGGPVETVSASRLWQRCGGNVLYLRELVDESTRLGLFERREGLWCSTRFPAVLPAFPNWWRIAWDLRRTRTDGARDHRCRRAGAARDARRAR